MKVAAVLDATMTPEQTKKLATLMEEGVNLRPAEVALATLLVNGENVRMVAYWNSQQALDEYLKTTPMVRGEQLMREVGVVPDSVTFVDVPAFG